jgi:hypothetical protein
MSNVKDPRDPKGSEKRAVSVFSSATFSMWDISDALRSLKVSHTIDPDEKTWKAKFVNMKREQPRSVHIAAGVATLRSESINFIVSSYGMLSTTNIPPLSGPDLISAIRTALLSDQTTCVQVQHMSPVDYINHVAKPSLLNKLLTEVQHIQPYALRKQTQALIVEYFNSRVSERVINTFLSKTLRLERLKPLIADGKPLRAAVEMLKNMDAETVALQTGVPSFDIQYFHNAGKPKVKK